MPSPTAARVCRSRRGGIMQGSVARKGKWILARKRLDVFLGYLHPDREQAGERYEQIRRILVTLFKCNGCPSAADAVDETIDRVIAAWERSRSTISWGSMIPLLQAVTSFLSRCPCVLPCGRNRGCRSRGIRVPQREERSSTWRGI